MPTLVLTTPREYQISAVDQARADDHNRSALTSLMLWGLAAPFRSACFSPSFPPWYGIVRSEGYSQVSYGAIPIRGGQAFAIPQV